MRNGLQKGQTPDRMIQKPVFEGYGAGTEKSKRVRAATIVRILIITVVSAGALFLLSRASLFSISAIDVTGIQYYSKSQIIDISGLSIGQNGFQALGMQNIFDFFALRCTKVEKDIIESCPYVKKVYAKYRMPDKILIEIEERSRSVVIPYQGFGLLLDDEGYVIDVVRDHQDTGLPIVRGVSFDKYALGSKLVAESDMYIDIVITLISAIRQSDMDTADKLSNVIDSIDVSDLKNIKLFIGDRFVVNLGDGSDIYYRVSALREIYYDGLTSGERGIIDFSRGNKPFFEPEPVNV